MRNFELVTNRSNFTLMLLYVQREQIGSLWRTLATVRWCAEDESRSLTARGKKLFCSLVVRQCDQMAAEQLSYRMMFNISLAAGLYLAVDLVLIRR